MNYKTLLAALTACLVIGCGSSEETNTSAAGEATTANTATTAETTTSEGSLAGTYVADMGGAKATLVIEDGGTFTMTSAATTGKGTYTKEGDVLTLTVTETDGKPASESDKAQPLVLTVKADGMLDGPEMMDFKKQ